MVHVLADEAKVFYIHLLMSLLTHLMMSLFLA